MMILFGQISLLFFHTASCLRFNLLVWLFLLSVSLSLFIISSSDLTSAEASDAFIVNVQYKEREGYAAFKAGIILHGVHSSDVGDFKLHYCDVNRYRDVVQLFARKDIQRRHLWDTETVSSLTSSVRASLVDRGVDMDLVDRIYYSTEVAVFDEIDLGVGAGEDVAVRSTRSGTSSAFSSLLYNCDHIVGLFLESKEGVPSEVVTADMAASALFINAARSVSYKYATDGSFILDSSSSSGDNSIYYIPYSERSNNNNPFLDLHFLSDVFSNYKLNDGKTIPQSVFGNNYKQYESISSILWNILQHASNTVSSGSAGTDDDASVVIDLHKKPPLVIIYQSLNTESGGSLAMRQLYADVLSLILPFIDRSESDSQEDVAFYCHDDNADHPYCINPPLTSLVITGEWCDGVLREYHAADKFAGLGIQWFLGFHHKNDFCPGRVRIAHTKYLQNNIATSVFGGYYLGCSMNNAIKPYILDFIHKGSYSVTNDALSNSDGVVPPIVKENLVIIDGDINSDYPLELGQLNFSHIFELINKNRSERDRIRFVIAKGLSYGELLNLLARSKVVIDLAFPGAERLTSEAVLFGAAVIGSSRWNSGGLVDHPGVLKIDPFDPLSLLDVVPRLVDGYAREIRDNVNLSRFYSYVLSQWRRSYHTTDVIISSSMFHLVFILPANQTVQAEYEALLTLLAYLYIFPTITVDLYVKDLNWFLREHYMLIGMLQEAGYIRHDALDPSEYNSWQAMYTATNARFQTSSSSSSSSSSDKERNQGDFFAKKYQGGLSYVNIIQEKILVDRLQAARDSPSKDDQGIDIDIDIGFLFPPSSKGKLGMIIHNNAILPQASVVKQAARTLLKDIETVRPNEVRPVSAISLIRGTADSKLHPPSLRLQSQGVTMFYNSNKNNNYNYNNILSRNRRQHLNSVSNENAYIIQLLADMTSSGQGQTDTSSAYYNDKPHRFLSVDIDFVNMCNLYSYNNHGPSPSSEAAVEEELPFVHKVTTTTNWRRFVSFIEDLEVSKSLCK